MSHTEQTLKELLKRLGEAKKKSIAAEKYVEGISDKRKLLNIAEDLDTIKTGVERILNNRYG